MVVTATQARYLSTSAAVVFTGVILSGPVAVTLVEIGAPQPLWQGIATFVRHYSWLQGLPYWFGFLIAGGFILFMASLQGTAKPHQRPFEAAALGFTIVSAALIFLNYVLQTGFIPQWVHSNDPMVAAFTMANPRSLGWALEMYGYALLGVGTAFAAPLFEQRGRQGVIRFLFAANAVVSIAAAMMIPIFPGWVLTTVGMILGAVWNILIMVVMVLVMVEFRFGRSPREIGL
jgi:hypothetical protein